MTKLTKYAAAFFLGMVVLLSILAQSTFKRNTSSLEQTIKAEANKVKPVVAPTNTAFKALSTNVVAPATAAPAAPAAPAKP